MDHSVCDTVNGHRNSCMFTRGYLAYCSYLQYNILEKIYSGSPPWGFLYVPVGPAANDLTRIWGSVMFLSHGRSVVQPTF